MTRRVLLSLLVLPAVAPPPLVWALSPGPPTIPYEAWSVPREPTVRLTETKPGKARPIPDDDLLHGADFVFTMGVGSGMHGLDVFRVDAAGAAAYVFSTADGGWWSRVFRVPSADVAKLRRLLVEVGYGSLAEAYHANVCDGTQWCIRVDVAGGTKQVYCDNYFPEAAERLADAVRRDFLAPHDRALRSARRIFRSTAREVAAPLWQ